MVHRACQALRPRQEAVESSSKIILKYMENMSLFLAYRLGAVNLC